MSPLRDVLGSTRREYPPTSEFGEEARNILFAIAHSSIAAAFDHRELDLTPPLPELAQPRGVFTTLYLQRGLRGCVGYVAAKVALYRAVAETAHAAAFEDTRFPAVKETEVADLKVSLSVLSGLTVISPEQIEIGRHGIVVSWAGRRGLLLPQVPLEYGWGRTTFLEQTCGKAGLPPDAWKNGAKIEAFTAEVFADAEAR